ncbi:MAG: hypothetical protein R3Y22_01600 [Bacteroidales bacterium]
MNGKFRYLVEGITKDIVIYIMQDDESIDLPTALNMFHNSETFSKLILEESGLYIESSSYVYELYLSEIKCGKLKLKN